MGEIFQIVVTIMIVVIALGAVVVRVRQAMKGVGGCRSCCGGGKENGGESCCGSSHKEKKEEECK